MAPDPEDGEEHDRRSKRSLVLLAAKVRLAGRAYDARLRNLSRTGALLESKFVPAAGTDLVFERGETVVAATVIWSEAPRFGIQFDVPIEESELLVHINPVKKKPPPPPGWGR